MAAVRLGMDRPRVHEWRQMHAVVDSGNELRTPPLHQVRRGRSMVQGDPSAPYFFDIALDIVVMASEWECQKFRSWCTQKTSGCWPGALVEHVPVVDVYAGGPRLARAH